VPRREGELSDGSDSDSTGTTNAYAPGSTRHERLRTGPSISPSLLQVNSLPDTRTDRPRTICTSEWSSWRPNGRRSA
jgi:hypothetical protein